MTSPDSALYTLRTAAMPGFALSGQLLRCVKQPAILGEMVGATIQGTAVIGRLSPCCDREVYETACRSHIIGVRERCISMSALPETGILDEHRRGPFATTKQETMPDLSRRETHGARALAWIERKWIWTPPANRPQEPPALGV